MYRYAIDVMIMNEWLMIHVLYRIYLKKREIGKVTWHFFYLTLSIDIQNNRLFTYYRIRGGVIDSLDYILMLDITINYYFSWDKSLHGPLISWLTICMLRKSHSNLQSFYKPINLNELLYRSDRRLKITRSI